MLKRMLSVLSEVNYAVLSCILASLGILTLNSIYSSVYVLSDSALIPLSFIVAIALLTVLTKILMSLKTLITFFLC